MSYRSFKRMLGENNLETKFFIMFTVSLLLIFSGGFLLFGRVTEEMVHKQGCNAAHSLIRTDLYETHWEQFDNQGAPLLKRASDELQKTIPQVQPRDPQLAGRLDDLSAAILREIRASGVENAGSQNLTNRSIRETLRPMEYTAEYLEPGFPSTDRYERTVVFPECPPQQEPGVALRYWWQKLDDPKVKLRFVYYTPLYADAKCVNCHSIISLSPNSPPRQNLRAGDLLCVAKISISDSDIQDGLRNSRVVLLATAILTAFFAVVAVYLIIRYVILRPLKHLRDVSDSISRGNIELRADIHTGDEFEELAEAFNRMLGHLVTIQQELRNVNGNLDLKVDELAQANVQLYEMNRMRSDFLATMSHELRTPLNSIIGFSEVLAGITSLTDKQKRYCENIQKSGKLLLDQINDILDLAKMESGKMEIRLTDFSIEGVVYNLCDLVRPLAEKKNIDLDCRVQPGLPPLHQDQGKLQQILNNLLSNAIKFTPDGGTVNVKAWRTVDQELMLTVSDTGVGIAEEDQHTIFEKFRQGKVVMPDGDAMKREFSGTGLGLSIVKEICRLLGGSISLHSELGKGSTFTVRLPWIKSELPRGEFSVQDELEELARRQRSDNLRQREVTSAVPQG